MNQNRFFTEHTRDNLQKKPKAFKAGFCPERRTKQELMITFPQSRAFSSMTFSFYNCELQVCAKINMMQFKYINVYLRYKADRTLREHLPNISA